MPILQWLDKDKTIKKANQSPYRLLESDPSLSYGDQNSGNMLIQGDNLEALKALLPYYANRVKCIYIDPPYNTGSAFEHYDDNLEHSKWLDMMYPRLELLRELLAEDGSIFIQIDDYEHAYLKILLDETFGRQNFINNIVWKRRGGSANPKNRLNTVTDHILWYSKTSNYNVNHIYSIDDDVTQEYIKKRFVNIDDSGRKFMKSPIQSPNYRPNLIYDYKGYKTPIKGYSISYEVMQKWDLEGKLCFPNSKTQNINRKIYLDEYKGQPIPNLWHDLKVINLMSKERSDFDGGQKPEALIERILTLATKENDLVLDSFLGSGTTAAVAHKMGRRYIGIEMGEHAKTHCAARLQKVIDGEQGGISKNVNWQGGGGFRFYHLGETIFDKDGCINKNIKFEYLAAHIWFSETKTPITNKDKSPLIGIYNKTAYYLLYNGILGDKSVSGGNVLTTKTLDALPKYNGKKVIYGETTRLSSLRLEENQITFKQTPYDIKAR